MLHDQLHLPTCYAKIRRALHSHRCSRGCNTALRRVQAFALTVPLLFHTFLVSAQSLRTRAFSYSPAAYLLRKRIQQHKPAPYPPTSPSMAAAAAADDDKQPYHRPAVDEPSTSEDIGQKGDLLESEDIDPVLNKKMHL